MSSNASARSRFTALHNLRFKSLAIFAACTLLVVTVIEFHNSYKRVKNAQFSLTQQAYEVNAILALQLGGPLQFSNTAAVAKIVNEIMGIAGQETIGTAVISADDALVVSTLPSDEHLRRARDLGRESLKEKRAVRSAGGLLVASPVFLYQSDALGGVVVTKWQFRPALTLIFDDFVHKGLVSLAISMVVLTILAWFLSRYLAQPLRRLDAAMAKVAKGDYESQIPLADRKDEVGRIASSLDNFRQVLRTAEANARESKFKGAAFAGSSAPMMVVDAEGKVVFVNAAARAQLIKVAPVLKLRWPTLSVADPIGVNLRDFTDIAPAMARIRDEGTDILPLEQMLRIDRLSIKVTISAITDAKGQMIGGVVEWADLSRSQRNSALIETIDASQIRMEFDAKGRLCAANPRVLELLGKPKAEVIGATIDTVFTANDGGGIQPLEMLKRVLNGEVVKSRLKMHAQDGKRFILRGSLTPIKAAEGPVAACLFLATDVTKSDDAMRSAEMERTRIAQEQQFVVEALGRALTVLSEGDLSQDISDEFPNDYKKLRNDYNAAIGALRQTVGVVASNAESIRSETAEITSAADDLSRRTEKQAATLEETAAALDELTVSVKSAARHADDASKMSQDARANAKQGGEVASQAVAAMDGIKNSSKEISKITSVIDDIAFQTNLLALNAGVEAARAGEAGRGFAVVATEVRALAQRSSDAASEINSIISMGEAQVREGVDLVGRTGVALASIVTSVSEISDRVSGIATSAREQSSGLAEINSAVNELDHVTQQNAAMFEETTAASHALTAEADALAGAVARFRMTDAPQMQNQPHEAARFVRATPVSSAVAGNLAFSLETELEEGTGWEEF